MPGSVIVLRPVSRALRSTPSGLARVLGVILVGVAGVAAVPGTPTRRGAITFVGATGSRESTGSASRAMRVPAAAPTSAPVALASPTTSRPVAAALPVLGVRIGTAGARSSWASVLPDSETTRWDPCIPVPVRYDATGAPWDLGPIVADRVAFLARLTGLDLRLGTTGTRPGGGAYGITIAWVADGSLGAPDTIAMTTPLAEGDRQQPGRSWLQRAEVRFDARAHVPAKRASELWGAVVTHELLHALGLGHTADPTQVMAVTTRTSLPLGAGDLEGIARVSAANGCRPTA